MLKLPIIKIIKGIERERQSRSVKNIERNVE